MTRKRVAGAIVLLTSVIEAAVVRHYGFAAIFITPLTILLAEAPTLGQEIGTSLIEARFLSSVPSMLRTHSVVCAWSMRHGSGGSATNLLGSRSSWSRGTP